jgi:hypothetical protein
MLMNSMASQPTAVGDLNLPSLLTTEWLIGYCGRVARINGLKPQIRGIAQRLHKAGPQVATGGSSAPAALIPAFASAVAMDPLTVVLNHTTWPAILATNRPSRSEILARLLAPDTRHIFSRPARREEWFCPACAREDLRSLPFSFWRRDHQLPGSFRCGIHHCALVAVERGQAVKFMPDQLVDSKALPISEVAQGLLDDQYAERASVIANAINGGTLNLEVDEVADLLLAHAGTRLKPSAEEISPEDIRALLREQVNSEWVGLALQYGSSQARDRFAYVDRLLFGNYGAISGAAVAIVAAALFASSDDAVEAMTPISKPFAQ